MDRRNQRVALGALGLVAVLLGWCGTAGDPAAVAGTSGEQLLVSEAAQPPVQIDGAVAPVPLTVGQKVELAATAVRPDGTRTDISGLAQWTTGDRAVATVDKGVVTGVGPGTTAITATYQGVKGSRSVKVTKPADGDRMTRALATGDPKLVTQQELLAHLPKALGKRESLPYRIIPDGAVVTFTPGPNSGHIRQLSPYLQPLLTGTHNGGSSDSPNRVLAAVGSSSISETRLAYFAGNPFVNTSLSGPNIPMDEAGMVPLVLSTTAWLLGKPGTAAGDLSGKIVIANTASSREKPMKEFLAKNFPRLTVNGGNSAYGACDFKPGTANPCLTGAAALFVGDAEGSDDPVLRAQIAGAYSSGIPLLVFGETSAGESTSNVLMRDLGSPDTGTNYFQRNLIRQSPKSAQAPAKVTDDQFARDATEIARRLNGNPLVLDDYSKCVTDYSLFGSYLTSCVDSPTPGAAAFMGAITRVKAMVAGLNASAHNVFAPPKTNDQNETMRVLALLADKQRTGARGSQPGDNAVAIDYPIDQKDPKRITQALFADWFVLTAWPGNTKANDLGTAWCISPVQVSQGTCPQLSFPPQTDRSMTFTATDLDEWTATRFDLIPGRAGTLTLTNDPNIPVYVRAFPNRVNTRTGEVENGVSKYTRPQFLATDWVRLPPNKPVTISSPYGGPLYIRMDGTGKKPGIGVNVAFAGMSQHPAVLDMNDLAQLDRYAKEIATTKAYYTDLVGDGFQLHVPVSRLRKTFEDVGLTDMGLTTFYTGPSGVRKFLLEIRDSWYNQEMRLAGLKVMGAKLEDTVPKPVQEICATYKWPCLDPEINSRKRIQHVNYDLYTMCGNLCSGNPIDMGGDGAVYPVSPGMNHELGHNLQRQQLNIGWADTGAGSQPGKIDTWTNYVPRSGETSNDIFTHFVLWNFARKVRPARGDGKVDDPLTWYSEDGFVSLFASHRSAMGDVRKDGKRVVYGPDCRVIQSYPASATAKSTLTDAVWGEEGTYTNRHTRLTFYLTLPILLEGKAMANGTKLDSGPDIYTALYGAARTFTAWAAEEKSWNERRGDLGLSLYPYSGAPAYGGKDVDEMIGNDFLLVQLSRITGYDFRPYFEAFGVTHTSLAGKQVEANAPADGLRKLTLALPVLGKFQPPLKLTEVRTVDLADPNAAWPGADVDGSSALDHVDFQPTRCTGS
ncbi:ImpA family metalloprotease [Crossiella sp. CA198]|uniref:ImpA family metalloprotease n=1 Tax=Crossiella sp. CA198 TaxID=3455607 RepID=UPI003F8D4606